MPVSYEVNPPKIDQNQKLVGNEVETILNKLLQRISEIKNYCKGIHITDSVLGIPRVPPITTSSFVRNQDHNLDITVSMRVIDKTITSITDLVNDAIVQNLNGILVLKGDVPVNSTVKNSTLIPSQVVKHCNELGFGKKIDLFLSLPSNLNFNKIQKKIDAEPKGFITQVIHSIDQVSRIVDALKPQGFKIIPIIMIPSEKNSKSAEFLKLDWSNYQDNVIDFVNEIHNIAGEVLVTSPNDFQKGKEILRQLS
jgi:homocysteine S-methyltransferase